MVLPSMYSLFHYSTSVSLFTFMHQRRKWQPTPVFLPGESHGQRSLVGYSPQGCKESDTTEATQHARIKTLRTYYKTIPCIHSVFHQAPYYMPRPLLVYQLAIVSGCQLQGAKQAIVGIFLSHNRNPRSRESKTCMVASYFINNILYFCFTFFSPFWFTV